jgi:hypothetical protein
MENKFEHLRPTGHYDKLADIRDRYNIDFDAYLEISNLLHDTIIQMNSYTSAYVQDIYQSNFNNNGTHTLEEVKKP